MQAKSLCSYLDFESYSSPNSFMGFSLIFHSIKIKSMNFICLANKMNTYDHLWMVHKFLVKMQVNEIGINLQNNFIPVWLNGAFRSIAFQVQNGYQSLFLVLKSNNHITGCANPIELFCWPRGPRIESIVKFLTIKLCNSNKELSYHPLEPA